ncbi:precorrin-6y C5,15-methyltransferase (decarboxylating) subunit CbiE [Kribbella hippodromi]|uniref:precorrin-6y C5,15-methyltransferase (decarboxylating) subunit CbiE n=1 Tax=Kribbella hippodromi TaxID=434347 RepID=UPI0031E2F70E
MITVVGIGADGWPGLTEDARTAIHNAQVLLGSTRQLALLPTHDSSDVVQVAWPSPLSEALPRLLKEHTGKRICVLASGDPTYHGIGTTLVRLLGPDAVHVIPHPSSVSLACARLGWPQDQIQVVSLVKNPVEHLHPHLAPDRRILVLSRNAQTPAEVAHLLTARGYGASQLTILEQLAAPTERIRTTPATNWPTPNSSTPSAPVSATPDSAARSVPVSASADSATPSAPDPTAGDRTALPAGWSGPVDPLNVIAIHTPADAPVLSTSPGLPDDTYESDGQLTKREVRAVTLSRLAPVPGQLLWDIGGGAGSIAIEWSRHHPSCRAIAIERDPARADRLARNATNLGVPVSIVQGPAPDALANLEPPHAIFIGGGATAPGMIEACWTALRPGGRLVTNGVTLETDALITQWHKQYGGDLIRLEVHRAAPLGTMTAWRPSLPVTIWNVTK